MSNVYTCAEERLCLGGPAISHVSTQGPPGKGLNHSLSVVAKCSVILLEHERIGVWEELLPFSSVSPLRGCHETCFLTPGFWRGFRSAALGVRLQDRKLLSGSLERVRLQKVSHDSHRSPLIPLVSVVVLLWCVRQLAALATCTNLKVAPFIFTGDISQALALLCLRCLTTCFLHLTKDPRNLSTPVAGGLAQSSQLGSTLGAMLRSPHLRLKHPKQPSYRLWILTIASRIVWWKC